MIKIASLDDIKENNMIQVELDGDLYLLARNENKVFLTSDICTHEDAELSMGCLEGKKVKCPLHGSWFCLETGKACLLYTSPSPRDKRQSRMPSSA